MKMPGFNERRRWLYWQARRAARFVGTGLWTSFGGQRRTLWRSWIRLWQVFRVMAIGSSGTLSLAVGVLSILLPLAAYSLTGDVGLLNAVFICLGIILVVAFFSSLTAWYALTKLPPYQYAEVTVGGRPAPEVLMVLAYEIQKACRRFCERATALQHATEQLKENGLLTEDPNRADAFRHYIDKNRKKLTRALNYLKDLAPEQHVSLQRLMVMKQLASKELDISQRRLCDYILDYSPSIQVWRVAEYIDNWDSVLSDLAFLTMGGTSIGRFNALLRANLSIYSLAESRIEVEERILSNVELLQHIHEMASQHSTSGAIKKYARAVRRAAEIAQKPSMVIHARTGPAEVCAERLLFLQRKQRAHSGFDLNRAISRLVQQLVDLQRRIANAEKDQQKKAALLREKHWLIRQHKTLSALARISRLPDSNWKDRNDALVAALTSCPIEIVQDVAKFQQLGESEEVEARLKSLKRLSTTIERAVDGARKQIRQGFEKVARYWFNYEAPEEKPRSGTSDLAAIDQQIRSVKEQYETDRDVESLVNQITELGIAYATWTESHGGAPAWKFVNSRILDILAACQRVGVNLTSERWSRQRIIITHGYSQTVLSAIENLIKNLKISLSTQLGLNANDVAPFLPQLFVMNSQDDPHDTQKMVQELHERSGRALDIAAGDEQVLLRLMRPGAHILTVIGAECFDSEGRVVHPRGTGPRLTGLRDLIRTANGNCVIAVVAEEYKFHENLVDISDFYRHHLDRLDVYPRDLTDLIISDDYEEPKFRPKNWMPNVDRRREF